MQADRVNPGDLDTLITVQAFSQVRGSQGQKSKTYTTYRKVWAQVTPATSEAVSDGNYEATTTVTVTLYKITELTTRWRLIINGVSYEITSIDTLSRWSPYCVITARTISNNG